MTRTEAESLMELAIGRLFLMGSRPTQDGDIATFYACRSVVMEAAEVLGGSTVPADIGYLRPGFNFGNLSLD